MRQAGHRPQVGRTARGGRQSTVHRLGCSQTSTHSASLKVHLQTWNVFSDACLLGPLLLMPIQKVKAAEGRALVSQAAHHGGSWHLKKTWGSNREIDQRP